MNSVKVRYLFRDVRGQKSAVSRGLFSFVCFFRSTSLGAHLVSSISVECLPAEDHIEIIKPTSTANYRTLRVLVHNLGAVANPSPNKWQRDLEPLTFAPLMLQLLGRFLGSEYVPRPGSPRNLGERLRNFLALESV